MYFITARPPQMRSVTELWLQKWLHGGTMSTLMSNRKHLIAAGLELNVMVEDNHETLVDVLRTCGRSCEPVLVSHPYNKQFVHSYITRVNNMTEALDKIEGL